jgi:hypothetical protein
MSRPIPDLLNEARRELLELSTRNRLLDTPLHTYPEAKLAKVVAAVIEIEGPMHYQEVAHRVRTLWGMPQAGARIQCCVDAALVVAGDAGIIRVDGEFVLHTAAETTPVRDRLNVKSQNLCKPELLPPAEIM